MTAASNALRRSGRASVMRRTSPSRSVREVLRHGEELRVSGDAEGSGRRRRHAASRRRSSTRTRSGRTSTSSSGTACDGVLALGTTGEGVLFSPAERREIAAAFVDAGPWTAPGRRARRRADDRRHRRARARMPREIGADAVAVIAPPYFALDEDELAALSRRGRARARRCRSTSTSSRRAAATRSRSP